MGPSSDAQASEARDHQGFLRLRGGPWCWRGVEEASRLAALAAPPPSLRSPLRESGSGWGELQAEPLPRRRRCHWPPSWVAPHSTCWFLLSPTIPLLRVLPLRLYCSLRGLRVSFRSSPWSQVCSHSGGAHSLLWLLASPRAGDSLRKSIARPSLCPAAFWTWQRY